MNISILWFKKDLRIIDYIPFHEASKYGYVLPLYIYEPEILDSEDYDPRHHQFINDSLYSLNRDFKRLGGYIHIVYGSAVEVFQNLSTKLFGNIKIYSHEETGNWISYQRDIQIKNWSKKAGIDWFEFSQYGVQRPIKNRDGWAYEWNKKMNKPVLSVPTGVDFYSFDNDFKIIDADSLNQNSTHDQLQKGGRKNGEEVLLSFLKHRGENYSKEMSSPLTAITSCSRLSPYISFGNLSIKEIYQASKKKRDSLARGKTSGSWRSSLSSFLGRLRWHCHFIQKLEDQPSIEWENMSRSYDNIRDDFNEKYFKSWASGMTGYPLIDACMRCLRSTGYINFRMRAMLVSFASYDLWLDWRFTSKYLATQFLDYEPGIHYSQFQMQSGVTGINSIRIYNPTKQQKDHDPNGVFVKKWVPELKNLPLAYIFSPHLMNESFQILYSCKIGVDYPTPIVDHDFEAKKAKKILYRIKASHIAKNEAQLVYLKHGSRKKQKR